MCEATILKGERMTTNEELSATNDNCVKRKKASAPTSYEPLDQVDKGESTVYVSCSDMND